MAFGCFAPSADTYATLPKGVALADPNAALSRRHSTKPTFSSAYRPSLDYSSSPTANEDTEDLVRSPTTGGIRQGVRKSVQKALIGFPTQFVHATHIGQDHIDRIIEEKNGLEDLSAAFTGSSSSYSPKGRADDEQMTGMRSFDEHAGALQTPPSRPLSPAIMELYEPISTGIVAKTNANDQHLVSRTVPADQTETGNAFGGRPRSPRPTVIAGLRSGPKRVIAKSITSRPPEDVLPGSHQEAVSSGHDNSDIVKRVKRKAAPVYVPSKIISAAPRAEESEELYAKDLELPIPLDDRGRPMHYVGGHYMTNTTKVKWDGTMDEISRALKMSF